MSVAFQQGVEKAHVVTMVMGDDHSANFFHGYALGTQAISDLIGVNSGINQESAAAVAHVGAISAATATEAHEKYGVLRRGRDGISVAIQSFFFLFGIRFGGGGGILHRSLAEHLGAEKLGLIGIVFPGMNVLLRCHDCGSPIGDKEGKWLALWHSPIRLWPTFSEAWF